MHRKRNLVTFLLHRAYDIASSYKLVHTEYMNVKRMLSRNGCSNNFLDRCIQQSQAQNTVSHDNIRQELSSFIKIKAAVSVKLRCFQNIRKLQSWFSVEERQALLNHYNVVYWLMCSCGASHLRQAQRNLINRIEEHRTSLSSPVCSHLQATPDHRVDFQSPSWRRLQILESLLIQEHKPELNANIPPMPLCSFNV